MGLVEGKGRIHRIDGRTDVSGQGHLGDRHQQAAIADIVHRGHRAIGDQLADYFAVEAFVAQVDLRRIAILAAVNLAQPQ